MRMRTTIAMAGLLCGALAGCAADTDDEDIEFRDADTYVAYNKASRTIFRPNGCVDPPFDGPWHPHQQDSEYVLDELYDVLLDRVFHRWEIQWGADVCQMECMQHGWEGAVDFSGIALQHNPLQVRDLGLCPGQNFAHRVELVVETSGPLACQCFQ